MRDTERNTERSDGAAPPLNSSAATYAAFSAFCSHRHTVFRHTHEKSVFLNNKPDM